MFPDEFMRSMENFEPNGSMEAWSSVPGQPASDVGLSPTVASDAATQSVFLRTHSISPTRLCMVTSGQTTMVDRNFRVSGRHQQRDGS
ncbi:hypothetical protein PC129_g7917 [Phytophthora cactorum]|uniref:Uncharacterized protein n=1 Tax=Phytophthora cactorum TaxID=29920 RepID=A0A8T1G6P6_9STRA|nr:hypothetical protein PC111_g6619 [Phytophthora cactorum]KAG2987808.1 hypothetical protein PC118_g7105 [Phytophthora cactorum]KAG3221371.1 hypothetical protein PC129_g7917 [Phytophthora cactorum]KAG4058257.1 hypothetical protein PC123_g6765 [Phytophthora cactorum]